MECGPVLITVQGMVDDYYGAVQQWDAKCKPKYMWMKSVSFFLFLLHLNLKTDKCAFIFTLTLKKELIFDLYFLDSQCLLQLIFPLPFFFFLVQWAMG